MIVTVNPSSTSMIYIYTKCCRQNLITFWSDCLLKSGTTSLYGVCTYACEQLILVQLMTGYWLTMQNTILTNHIRKERVR